MSSSRWGWRGRLQNERDIHTDAHGRRVQDRLRAARPRPGVLRLARHLRQTCGMRGRMAIATSSSRHYLALKQERNAELFALFDAVVCGDEPALRGRGKPQPDIFLLAAERVGLRADQCVAFEDAAAGVAAAVAARCVAVVATPDPRLDAAQFATASVVVADLAAFDPASVGLPPYADGAGA